jgi:translation initiation factor IF-1
VGDYLRARFKGSLYSRSAGRQSFVYRDRKDQFCQRAGGKGTRAKYIPFQGLIKVSAVVNPKFLLGITQRGPGCFMRRRHQNVVEYDTEPGDTFGRVLGTLGSNIFSVETGAGVHLGAFLPSRLRSVMWIRRGSFVVLRLLPEATELSIVHILNRQDIKALTKEKKWPSYFTSNNVTLEEEESEEESEVEASDDSMVFE